MALYDMKRIALRNGPPGSTYLVVPHGVDALGWCRDLGVVLAALQHFRINMPEAECEVIRIEDGKTIWPWLSPGGDA